MKKKWNNPYTAVVVVLGVVVVVSFVLASVCSVRGEYGWYLLCEGVGVVAAVAFGVALEKRKQYLWQRSQELMLREFLEFARENCRAQGADTPSEPFEEFLERNCGNAEGEEQREE